MVPLFMKGHCFQPFFEKQLPWGAVLENGSLFSGGTVFFLNMIIKGKNGSLFAKGIRFPFQYTFLQCDLMITDPDY